MLLTINYTTRFIKRAVKSLNVKPGSTQLLSFALASIILSTFLVPAFGIQLNALVVPKENKAEADYRSIIITYIEYPNGGKLKSMLEGVNHQIAFTADKNTPGVQEFIDRINQALVRERQSPASVDDIRIEYRSTLKGDSSSATLEHSVKMDITLTHLVIRPGDEYEDAIIDLNWRGFGIKDPVIMKTEQYGDVEINFPSGHIYNSHADVMKALENTEAAGILNQPSFDYNDFATLTLDKWHWSFDTTGIIKEAEQWGFKELGGAKVVTFFALGESSIREGIHKETSMKAAITVDGVPYTVRSTTPPSSASIQILGYATESIQGSDEGAIVAENAPEGGRSYTGGFPITVLMVMGGMLGAVAGFVLWRANKK
jgi:hypothetical protein